MTVNTTELRDHFQREGLAIARQLFFLEETTAYRDHYMLLSEEGPIPIIWPIHGTTVNMIL